ncbi:hypothetical protein B0H13DRAFT_1908755 [Mycena leptocephala]|nr:hypothetical protein B0H13DRAFT_1908755 [Mycena leptocephala]
MMELNARQNSHQMAHMASAQPGYYPKFKQRKLDAEVRLVMEDLRHLMGQLRQMSVQAREIRAKRRDPRRKRLRAPKTVQVRPDEVQVRRRPNPASHLIVSRLSESSLDPYPFLPPSSPPPCILTGFAGRTQPIWVNTVMDEWQSSSPFWDGSSEVEQRHRVPHTSDSTAGVMPSFAFSGTSDPGFSIDFSHLTPLLPPGVYGVPQGYRDNKYFQICFQARNSPPQAPEQMSMQWDDPAVQSHCDNFVSSPPSVSAEIRPWDSPGWTSDDPSSEMFLVEPDVDLANEAPDMDMHFRWEWKPSGVKWLDPEVSSEVVDFPDGAQLTDKQYLFIASREGLPVGAATLNVIVLGTTAALPPSSSSELPVSAPSVPNDLNVAGARRVSARKGAQADSSGGAPVSSDKRQKKLEDPLAE